MGKHGIRIQGSKGKDNETKFIILDEKLKCPLAQNIINSGKEVPTIQKTLIETSISSMPKVKTTDGHLMEWDRNAVVAQLLKETKLSEQFYGSSGITEEEAKDIAKEAEKRIIDMNLKLLSGPLVREIVNVILLERGHEEWKNISTRVGTPVYDAYKIDVGNGFEANSNANLQNNAETSHKHKADKMSKEQYLLMLPNSLSYAHLNGDIHIHDLEYFGTRFFCIDGNTAIPTISKDIVSIIKPSELNFEGEYYYPDSMFALTPNGYRKIEKFSRRKVTENEMLEIITTSGKTIKVTKEHRIPVNNIDMEIKRAEELKIGDILYNAEKNNFNIRGKPINEIDLIKEFTNKVPEHLIKNVFVRGLKKIFEQIINEGKSKNFNEISNKIGIKHNRSWFKRGILPILIFKKFCEIYNITDYRDVKIGVTGSKQEFSGVIPITSEIVKLLGSFVAERNYNVNKKLYLLFRYVFGIPEKSNNKRIPYVVYNLNDELLSDFLSSLFTSCGSVDYIPEKSDCIINYTTISETLRQELSILLISLGMNPHIVKLYDNDNRSTIYRIQLNGYKNIETFNKNITFYNKNQSHIIEFLKNVKQISINQKPEIIKEINQIESSCEHVYDVFLEKGETEKDHTFFVSDGLLIHNCQDWDLRYFFYYGLMPDGSGTKASVAGPAKKPEVAVLHAVKALGSAQTNMSGGQGFYNFLTFLAPYLEGMEYEEIEQLMQMFVYEMTQMMVARGGQLVFSSVQLSPGVPSLWRDKPVVYKGRIWDGKMAEKRTYGEFEREVRLSFKALMNVMLKGDYWGKPFNFPKPEISIEPDFIKENEEFNKIHPELPTYDDLYTMAFELAAKYGSPYFDNQLPQYRGAGKGISCYQCLDKNELVTTIKDEIPKVASIETMFNEALKNGEKFEVDINGNEFINLNEQTYSLNFKDMIIKKQQFKGIMRRKYHGIMYNIILEHNCNIKTTPDHQLFVQINNKIEKRFTKELKINDKIPIVKDNSVTFQKITNIKKYNYYDYVYDFVDVGDDHNFSNADGIVSGNCCAYNFSSSHEKDNKFEDKLYFKDGQHISMGACQVVSLNCPRIAYKSNKNDSILFAEIKKLMDICVELFKIKRKWMDEIIKNNRMPFLTQRPKDPITMKQGEIAVDVNGLVYTIGVVGINEMVQHHTGKQIHESEDARRLAVRTMYEMKFYAKELSKKHSMEIALARTPAETTAQRFAVSDVLHNEYRKCAEPIIKGNLNEALKNISKTRDLPIYYTNGIHVPPSAEISLAERIKIEEVFFPIVDGGNILHIWLGEAAPDPRGLKELAMNIAKNTQVGYFAFTKDMTVCMNDYHVEPGIHDVCPNCKSNNVEHLSRVTGYIQSVSGWNEGKKQELKDRKRYGVGR